MSHRWRRTSRTLALDDVGKQPALVARKQADLLALGAGPPAAADVKLRPPVPVLVVRRRIRRKPPSESVERLAIALGPLAEYTLGRQCRMTAVATVGKLLFLADLEPVEVPAAWAVTTRPQNMLDRLLCQAVEQRLPGRPEIIRVRRELLVERLEHLARDDRLLCSGRQGGK